MITKTYNKQRKFDPQWWFLIAFIIAVLIINVFNCSGQWLEISHRNDACNDVETAYITGVYPSNVYSMSLFIYYDYYSWNLIQVGKSDVFIDGFMLDSVYSDRWIFSWYSLHALQVTDTLFSMVFQRIGNFGGGDLEWHAGFNEITDFNSNPIPCTFIDGWLRCLSGIVEREKKDQDITKFIKDGKMYIKLNGRVYDLLGIEY